MRPWLKALVMAGLWAWTNPPQALAQQRSVSSFVPPRPANVAEVFASGSNDLVVVGTVDSVATVYRGFARTCSQTQYSWDTYLEIRLRLEQVIFGTAEDTVLRVTILDSTNPAVLNHRVLLRAHRSCDDDWRLRGRFTVLDEDVVTLGGLSRAEVVRPNDLLADLTTSRPNPFRVFGETSALLLARIQAIHGWTESGASYDVEPIRWVAGSYDQSPRTVVFPRLPDCFPNMFTGDSLLVPLPSTWTPSDSLVLDDCPSALRVKFGFAPGLGRQIDDLEPALMRFGTKMFLRPIQSRVQKDR